MMRPLILVTAVICMAMPVLAAEPLLPKGAGLRYHFDNSVTDADGNASLGLFNRRDCSDIAPITDPDFDRKTGGLRLNDYFIVDYDISSLKRISIVMRARLGRIKDDEGPCAVVNSRYESPLRYPLFFCGCTVRCRLLVR